MGQKKHIGLVYGYKPGWIGGTYYIENIVRALEKLSEETRPQITLFCLDDNSLHHAQQLKFSYVTLEKIRNKSKNIFIRSMNKFFRLTIGKDLILPTYQSKLPNSVYPYLSDLDMIEEKVNWIPDFQNRYLPDMFDVEDLKSREEEQKRISTSGTKVVFSSYSALNDFKKFYPEYNNSCYVVNFACTQPNYKILNINEVLKKYRIDTPYFMAPNQLWKHKNQMTVLKALSTIKRSNFNLGFKVVFTGKELDDRNITYVTELKSAVIDLGLEKEVYFLGFIDRNEQLLLMENAIAIIQPSLFEGWSTVVEDAKSMSQFVILSDIPVHREQMDKNVAFFDPQNHLQLADLMDNIAKQGVNKDKIDYESNILQFAKDFISVF